MQIYKAPIREYEFLLDVFGYDEVMALEPYEAYDREVVSDMLEQGANFFTNEFLPLNKVGDQEGVTYDPKTYEVKTPTGFKELYQKCLEQQMFGLVQNPEYGGGGAPEMLGVIFSEMGTSTNKSFSMCPGLTRGLIESLEAHGTQELKDAYLPKLVTGEWTGTMCLTEPQCGTDLGLIKTKAVPEGDHYLLTGTKIWITFGEHDMAENIVHLVLARLPDAPEGIKGISLFIVPKFTLDGERNPVNCGGLEHKMGIHASPTCVINMENAKGWLVGTPHKGMRAMFTMMNNERLGVGLEGVSLGEISYQTALSYAKDRRQMRSLDPAKQDPNAKADCILVHPDIRRQLLNIKSTNEPMRAFAYWVAQMIDISRHHPDESKREGCDKLVQLLTPIVKSYLTERGCQNTDSAMQILGGSGYTQDWCIEQYFRDLRIAMIYEGTNHIQALDLVGRKLPRNGGELYMAFNEHLSQFIRENKEDEAMKEFLEPLKATSKKLMNATMNLGAKAMEDREEAGAVASNYLNLFAFTIMSYMWCRMVKHSLGQEGKYFKTKIKTARYFFNNVLPEVETLVARIDIGKKYMMDLEDDEF